VGSKFFGSLNNFFVNADAGDYDVASFNILLAGAPAEYSVKSLNKLLDLADKNPLVRIAVERTDLSSPQGLNIGKTALLDEVLFFPGRAEVSGVPKRINVTSLAAGDYLHTHLVEKLRGDLSIKGSVTLNHEYIDGFRQGTLDYPNVSELLGPQHFFVLLKAEGRHPLLGALKAYPHMACSPFIICAGRWDQLAALVFVNLLNEDYFAEAPNWIEVALAITLSCLFLFVWNAGIGWAAVTMGFFWLLLLLAHVYAVDYTKSIVPLGSVFYFSGLFGIVGGLNRLNKDSQLIVQQRENIQARRVWSSFQEKFLEKFSTGLFEINKKIIKITRCSINSGLSNEEVKSLLLKLDSCAVELSDYLESIVSFSSVTSSTDSLSKRVTFDLRTLLERVRRQFYTIANDKSIEILIACPADITLVSSPTIIELIVSNLLANAIKYSKIRSEVRVSGEVLGRREVRIAVHDHGLGIAKEYHELIFEKFYRITDDNIHLVKGNGLGLYLCRFFSKTISGDLTMESELGKGSTFTLKISRTFQK